MMASTFDLATSFFQQVSAFLHELVLPHLESLILTAQPGTDTHQFLDTLFKLLQLLFRGHGKWQAVRLWLLSRGDIPLTPDYRQAFAAGQRGFCFAARQLATFSTFFIKCAHD